MFANRLKTLRETGGYQSQQALARALGVAQSTVANWECGRREPNHETTAKLADFFGVTVDYLMGRCDEPHGAAVSEEGLKAAFWGGEEDLTPEEIDELWQDVREYAELKLKQCRRKRQ